MKYALVSDIHGNLEALTAVLHDIEKQHVDSIHCLGDVIGYGPDPVACLRLVDQHCDTKLMGNHEFTALGLQSAEVFNNAARKAVEWTRTQLTDTELSMMADFLMDRSMDDMFLVHASPFEPQQWHYILTVEEAELAFQHLKSGICFFGHSHLPMIIRETADESPHFQVGHTILADTETRYLINAGSVGQPRDNDPRACYLVFDDDEREISFNRVEYDINVSQQKMTTAFLPDALISRLAKGV
ncbi:MAG: metallophosphoesterase family protein [candidate division Zixibacteria bacterium]|nr:metallophosphoesterase family protein [candidate division Zixibacteria bacterium]